jgi:hypothetical protein
MLLDTKRWTMPEVVPFEGESVEVLKAARLRIMQGWCPDAGSDNQGGVCALIAITRSADWTHNDFLCGMADKTMGYLRRSIGQSDIIAWNDTPGRTQAEVAAAFDRAIEIARADA